MNFVSLFYSGLIPLANHQILIYFFDSSLGVGLKLMVLFIDGGKCIADGAYIMILLLFHVLVHALHAHDHGFLLAVEHQ